MSPNQAQALRRAPTPTIVLTGGGSGGHITPLLSLAHELKVQSPKCKIIYIGLKGEKVEGLQGRYEAFDDVRLITAGKFRRYHGESFLAHLIDLRTLILNTRDFFKVGGGIVAARRILKKERPAVVFSKGGFVVVPVGIAAHQLSIPIVTHDSDALEGLSNKIIGRWAAVHATGMPPIYYDYPPSTIRYVGIPVDERIKPVSPSALLEFKKKVGLNEADQLLLVAGGGLGSERINDLLSEIAPQLMAEKPALHIVHITGAEHEQAVRKKYQMAVGENIKRITILGFTPDFYKYSSAADLIITRAGATTLAEFALQGKACIVIPSPFLTGGHQLKNAEQLRKIKAIEVVSNNAEPSLLLKVVEELLDSDKKRQQLATNLATTAHPKAAEELAQIILQVAGKR